MMKLQFAQYLVHIEPSGPQFLLKIESKMVVQDDIPRSLCFISLHDSTGDAIGSYAIDTNTPSWLVSSWRHIDIMTDSMIDLMNCGNTPGVHEIKEIRTSIVDAIIKIASSRRGKKSFQ